VFRINEVEKLEELVKRLNYDINDYVNKYPYLKCLTPADESQDIDNLRWNIRKIKTFINNKELSSLQLASRVLEHVSSGLYTPGSWFQGELRYNILKTLNAVTPEIFNISYQGFSIPICAGLPVLDIQSDTQVGKMEEFSEEQMKPEQAFETVHLKEKNDLKRLINSLNAIFIDYVGKGGHSASHHNRAWNIKAMIDIITIPDGDMTKFNYITANELALRIYEHVTSDLFRTSFHKPSTLRNSILAVLEKYSYYLRVSYSEKTTKAYLLHETDTKHLEKESYQNFMKAAADDIQKLRARRNNSDGSYHELAAAIAEVKFHTADLTDLISNLETVNKEQKSEITTLSADLEKLHVSENAQAAKIELLKDIIKSRDAIIRAYEQLLCTDDLEQAEAKEEKSVPPRNNNNAGDSYMFFRPMTGLQSSAVFEPSDRDEEKSELNIKGLTIGKS
jgi:hypothetical protein